MTSGNRLVVAAGLLASLTIGAVQGARAAEPKPNMVGMWIWETDATVLYPDGSDQRVGKSVGAAPRIFQIDRAGSGRLVTVPPEFTPELAALNYVAYDPEFEGSFVGNIAFGTRARNARADGSPPCRSDAALRLAGETELELVYPLDPKQCAGSIKSLDEMSGHIRFVLTLRPLYVVREVRFIDRDQASGTRITKAASDQKFNVEVEFKVPPPAPVYVKLGHAATQRVVVRPTGNASVFSSDVVTLNSLKGQQRSEQRK